MDVKGERGRNKTVQGHTHPPALLLLHTHTHTQTNTHQLKYTFVRGGEEVDGVGERLLERWISCLDVR